MFCLRLLPFNPKFAQKMNKLGVIPILADILSDSVREEVTRIILAVFRVKLIEKPEEPNIAKEHCIAMVQSKVLKQLSILEQWKFDDEDIIEDVHSFDGYASEVKCGRLEWSPVHRSAQFWRENAASLNDHNYELLCCLVHLLDTSKDALVLSVASFDVGEYVRHYPQGKQEYLGRQLEKEQGSTTTTAKSAAGVLAGKTSM
ncbi:unnamed protein product [Bemisia tabaci]|uniref:ATPase V1 complex subunit H C-terminal domain-containing protein n=1 Tax=Bemisia tabaci TaxID=7038 RepID=A0A9P0AAT6_BEMTA|nr:unnamed protein product [Bemisia tabaci]